MTVEEVAVEMDRHGLWEQEPFRRHRGQARLDFLADILRGDCDDEEDHVWTRVGYRYKHAALLTDEDQALREDWVQSRRAAFDDDLSRILLGESPLWREQVETPPQDLRELLRRARPLVDELSAYVWQECETEEDLAGTDAAPPVARRIGELAVALTNLFESSAEPSTNG
jgi:hypothetical protein